MHSGIFSWARCLATLVALGGGWLLAADPQPLPPSSGQKVPKVLPFVEDEEEAAMRAAQKKAPPKSNFQPRFRTPAVRQAQHLEPVEPTVVTDNEPQRLGLPPEDEASPVQPETDNRSGRELIDAAYQLSQSAESESEYSEIIDLCRRASGAGLPRSFDEYSRNLLSWAYNRRGEARAKTGQDSDALLDFEAAVENNKSAWRAVHNRGVSYAAQGRVREALRDFAHTIELKPDYPHVYFNRAELEYHQGNFAAAIDDYTAALQAGGPDATVLNCRGHALYQMEQFGEALRDYSEALSLDPENAAALVNRGDLFSDLGKYREAAADYRQAVEVAPNSSRAYQSAAWLMATCPDENYRNDTLAVEAAKRAIELGGENDYRCWETLAAAEASAGLFDRARDTQERAIALAPKDHMVTSEKRMALYQRELAYRERPRVAASQPANDFSVRQASATSREPSAPATMPRELPRQPGPATGMPRELPQQPGQSFNLPRELPQQAGPPIGMPRQAPQELIGPGAVPRPAQQPNSNPPTYNPHEPRGLLVPKRR